MNPLTVKLSIGTLVSILFVLIAYLVAVNYNDSRREYARIDATLKALLKTERAVVIPKNRRVAIGFGSCQDLIVQSSHVILTEDPPEHPEHFDTIKSKEALLKVFAYFFQHGAAAERYVANTSLFQDLVLTAARAPGVRWELGGNAAVMASRFAKEGWQPLLGSQVSPQLQSMVPPRVHLSGPQVARDDVHLLLEYPSGASWGPFSAPRANRFIIHSDHQNPLLISLENFAERLSGWEPHLVVVGGLQMLDNFPLPPAVRKDRLDRLRHMLVQQHAPVHFEMASFTDVSLMQAITDSLLPHTDSLGMNEQELPNLHNLVVYGNVSLVAESTPRVAPVLDQMRELFAALNKRTASVSGSKRLTRLHVHTLAFQAILTSKDSPWRNTKNAAAKAALTANRHTCGTRHVDPSRSRILLDDSFTTSLDPKLARKIPFSQEDPVTCWEEDQDLGFCLAPVLVCTDVLQTGGGGDNVSSAGLVLQI